MSTQQLPLARSSDPITSHLAAEGAIRFRQSHAQRILSALQDLIAGDGMTAKQIARSTGLTVVQVDRRLPELQRDGKARVVQLGGSDRVVNGFRVWEAV